MTSIRSECIVIVEKKYNFFARVLCLHRCFCVFYEIARRYNISKPPFMMTKSDNFNAKYTNRHALIMFDCFEYQWRRTYWLERKWIRKKIFGERLSTQLLLHDTNTHRSSTLSVCRRKHCVSHHHIVASAYVSLIRCCFVYTQLSFYCTQWIITIQFSLLYK